MQFNFDLISDLHIETWPEFDWTYQATSPYCIVAGDVSRDLTLLAKTLTHLGQCYHSVFYIDGNDEHRDSLTDLGKNYKTLKQITDSIDNVVYLQDHVVIVNGVAVLATNGWWSFDLDKNLDYDQSHAWYCDRMSVPGYVADSVASIAYNDTAYMANSVRKLQTHKDVRAIVCVTHTVPAPWLVSHDLELIDTWKFNCLGNPHMAMVLDEDTENKIHTWCFGHYHKPVDQYLRSVRYVSNCKGRGNTDWSQSAYYPKRITVEI